MIKNAREQLVPALTTLAFLAVSLFCLAAVARAETSSPMSTTPITGPFEVKMTPQSAADAPVGRFTLDKHYHGTLEGQAVGEMLAAMTTTKGSAGYVALEKFTGTLAGKHGSFNLQHSGTMNRGAASLIITVVPDSGTDELAGLTGTMDIKMAPDGAHSYVFSYTLPAAK